MTYYYLEFKGAGALEYRKLKRYAKFANAVVAIRKAREKYPLNTYRLIKITSTIEVLSY